MGGPGLTQGQTRGLPACTSLPPSLPSTSEWPQERENQAHRVPGALGFTQQ